jgi:hypothetical protein
MIPHRPRQRAESTINGRRSRWCSSNRTSLGAWQVEVQSIRHLFNVVEGSHYESELETGLINPCMVRTGRVHDDRTRFKVNPTPTAARRRLGYVGNGQHIVWEGRVMG